MSEAGASLVDQKLALNVVPKTKVTKESDVFNPQKFNFSVPVKRKNLAYYIWYQVSRNVKDKINVIIIQIDEATGYSNVALLFWNITFSVVSFT